MKKNLARMLGMEEMQQASIPSETRVNEVDNLEQFLGNHTQANSEALECISNAIQLQSIIQQNNSTDKTTYDVLKVAVEQLKQRTGVFTQGLALENLNSLSYKQESLEDMKAFITKVWEAIKKAFAAMWEKIKSFFSKLFDKDKSIAKEEKETEELYNSFQKAESKMASLGYTEGTTNKTFVKSGDFNTGEKQPEYSGNFDKNETPFKGGDTYAKAYTEKVKRYLGWDSSVAKHSGYSRKLTDHISQLSKILDSLDYRGKALEESFKKDYTTAATVFESVYNSKDLLGVDISITKDSLVFDISFNYHEHASVKVYPFQTLNIVANAQKPTHSYIEPTGKLLTKSSSVLEEYSRSLKNVKEVLDIISKRQLSIPNEDNISDQEKSELFEEMKSVQKEYTVYTEYIKSLILCASKFHAYLQEFHLAILLYVRETINLSVSGYVKEVNKHGATLKIDSFVSDVYGGSRFKP